MSPPFTPPKGRKDKKARAGFAVYVVIDACLAIWGQDCLQRGNVELSYLLYLIFSCLMICGGGKEK